VPESKLVLGKHSGRHALGVRCAQLGYKFERRDLDRVYKRFVALADEIKTVEDRHLLTIIAEEIAASGMDTFPEPASPPAAVPA